MVQTVREREREREGERERERQPPHTHTHAHAHAHAHTETARAYSSPNLPANFTDKDNLYNKIFLIIIKNIRIKTNS